MEFIVSRNSILRALNQTRHAITKGDINVFKCFVFTFDDEERLMTVHASNGSMWITETVVLDAPAKDARSIAVYYLDLLRPIKSLEEQPLRFIVGDSQMTVTHSIGSFRLPLCNTAEEFLYYKRPNPDVEAKDGYYMEYEAPGLRSILSRCNFAMAQDELRPAMNGVYMNLTEDYSDYVSSDGHKLVRVRKSHIDCHGKESSLSFIIPSPVVKALLRMLPSTGDVEIEYQKEKRKKESKTDATGHLRDNLITERQPAARIVIDDALTIAFNTVDSIYPKYWSVIPNHHSCEMLISRRALVKSVDRLSLFATDAGLMKMTVTADTVSLSTTDTDFEVGGDETLPCESKPNGGDVPVNLSIGMNCRNMAATLKALTSERVALRFIDSSRAVIFHPVPQPDNEEITILLMPMLCND